VLNGPACKLPHAVIHFVLASGMSFEGTHMPPALMPWLLRYVVPFTKDQPTVIQVYDAKTSAGRSILPVVELTKAGGPNCKTKHSSDVNWCALSRTLVRLGDSSAHP
jgi:hypothetical protein